MKDVDFTREEETARQFDLFLKELNQLIERRLDPLLGREGAEYVREALRRRRKDFGNGDVKGAEAVEALKKAIRAHKFHSVCPSCCGARCGDCFGKGWVSAALYAKLRQVRKDK